MSSTGIHGGAGASGGGSPSDPSEVNIIEYGSVATTLGQKAMAASVPVVVASDQSAIPVSGTVSVTEPVSVDDNGGSLTVDAIDLDIRNLVFATDKVDASGTTLGANSGVDVGDVTINNAAGASAVNIQDGGNSITVDGAVTTSGTVTETNSAAIAASLSVIDDWDETNRAAVNTIAGQAGVQGGAGTVTALTQRVALATDAATVTANAGTNLNTSALALETTQAAQLSRADTFKTRSDTFTATGNGTTVDASTSPVSAFAVQVTGTGAAATTWDVRLEGSLNNSGFTQILQHTQVTGDTVTLWTGALEAPTLYFRARVAGLALGAATNIVVVILGQN